MADQFWIQVQADGTIISKQRTSGRTIPNNAPNRTIRVSEDFYQRCFMNPSNARGDYLAGVEYLLDETITTPGRADTDIDEERKLHTKERKPA